MAEFISSVCSGLFQVITNNNYSYFGLFQWTIKHQGLDAVMNYGCEFEVKMRKR